MVKSIFKNYMMTNAIPLSFMILSICGYTAVAGGPIPIGKVLEDPQSYQLHVVTLKGIVKAVQPLEEPYYNGLICYGAYTFMLEDKTGSLEVIVPGMCGKGKVDLPKASEGEKVLLEATIQAPGHYMGDGLPPMGEDRTTTRAVTTKIWTNGK